MIFSRSLILAACVVTGIYGEPLSRRFLNLPINLPNGDPSHQGGSYVQTFPLQHQQQQPNSRKCATPTSPCHGSMHYDYDLNCHVCDSQGNNYVATSSAPMQTSGQWQTIQSSKKQTTNSPIVSTSTSSTQTPTSLPVTTTTTVLPPTTTTAMDYCNVAKQLCKANCPDGYLVDPDDCTFCICKKDALSG